MNTKKRKVYLFFLILYSFLIVLVIVAFSFLPDPLANPEGNFITPGNVQIEWIFAILMAGLCGTIAGLISVFFTSTVFLKGFIKALGKNIK